MPHDNKGADSTLIAILIANTPYSQLDKLDRIACTFVD